MTARWQDTALAEWLAEWAEVVEPDALRGPRESLLMSCHADGSARSAVVPYVGWVALHPHPAARYLPGVDVAIDRLVWHRGIEAPRMCLHPGWTAWVLVDASWVRERYR